MLQRSLFGLDEVVNVASVPKRSPFRYPGGKTWLVPRIRQWLSSLSSRPAEFIEPFAGGGIVSLTAAFERLAERITMVELDPDVAAVWATIVNGDAEWLANRVVKFDFNIDNIKAVLDSTPQTAEERAFRTILKNRVQRGGILSQGAGLIKYGENGKGIASRRYPKTLQQRILDIIEVRNRITVIEGDGVSTIQENAARSDAVFFIDPPYTAAGKKAGSRLYDYSELDHDNLFRITASVAGDFLMTYDNEEDVQKLAEKHGFDTEAIAMKNTHHAKMKELLIGRDLEWARRHKAEELDI